MIGAVAAALIPLFASAAGAAPAPDPGQQAADARRGANDAAARYAEIQTRYDILGDQIVTIEQKIQAGEARATELRGIAQRRAAVAYKNAGADLGLGSTPRTRAKARGRPLCSIAPTRPTTARSPTSPR